MRGGLPDHILAAMRSAPSDPRSELRPDLMLVEPDTVVPGQEVDLRFPAETMRGMCFAMEREMGGSWAYRFTLASRGPEPSVWQVPGDPGNFECDAMGIGGPGPQTLTIPDAADAGDWRICTLHALENFCAALTVVPE